MRRALKWLGTIVGGLLGLLLLAFATVYLLSESRLNQTYAVQPDPLAVEISPDAVARGEHLVESIGFCQDCHGEDLAGDVTDDDPLMGRLIGPNLTTGEGGLEPDYGDEDFVRAIRHGVDRDGYPLIVMPADFFYNFSDDDLAAIIAYLRSLPAIDNDPGEIWVGPLGRLFVLIEPAILPAANIDHDAPRPPAPEPGVTVEYGRYLATNCVLCHGEDMAGVPGEGGGLNLTPGGDLGQWTEAQFLATIRTGETPEGEQLDPELMPWRSIRRLSDDELRAIWLYLQSLPPVINEETSAGRSD